MSVWRAGSCKRWPRTKKVGSSSLLGIIMMSASEAQPYTGDSRTARGWPLLHALVFLESLALVRVGRGRTKTWDCVSSRFWSLRMSRAAQKASTAPCG